MNKKQEIKKEPVISSQDNEIKPVEPTVSKEAFESLMKTVNDLRKDRDILMQSADKKALSRYYSRNKGDMPPVVIIRSIGGKVILGWRMVEDKGSYQIPGTSKWTEYQVLEIIYQDGTKEEMTEGEFERRHEKKIKAKVIKTMEDNKSGESSLELERLDNGKKLTIGVAFIN